MTPEMLDEARQTEERLNREIRSVMEGRGSVQTGTARDAVETIRALVAEIERLQADNATLSEPDGWWDPVAESSYLDPDELTDCLDPGDGAVRELLPYHHLPSQWAAYLVLTRDADGDPDETEIQLFPTKAEAVVALQASQPSTEEPSR